MINRTLFFMMLFAVSLLHAGPSDDEEEGSAAADSVASGLVRVGGEEDAAHGAVKQEGRCHDLVKENFGKVKTLKRLLQVYEGDKDFDALSEDPEKFLTDLFEQLPEKMSGCYKEYVSFYQPPSQRMNYDTFIGKITDEGLLTNWKLLSFAQYFLEEKYVAILESTNVIFKWKSELEKAMEGISEYKNSPKTDDGTDDEIKKHTEMLQEDFDLKVKFLKDPLGFVLDAFEQDEHLLVPPTDFIRPIY